MIRLFQIYLVAKPIVRAILRRLILLASLAILVPTGCGGSGEQREQVNASQTEVVSEPNERVAIEAEARKSLTDAHTSIEPSRTTHTRQPSEIQKGLISLESERNFMELDSIIDMMMFWTIEPFGNLVAVFVLVILACWLTLRFLQTDSRPEVEDIVTVFEHPEPISPDEIWRNLKPVAIADNRLLPETQDHDAWMEDT